MRENQKSDLTTWPVTAIMSRPAVAVPMTATMAETLSAFAMADLRHRRSGHLRGR